MSRGNIVWIYLNLLTLNAYFYSGRWQISRVRVCLLTAGLLPATLPIPGPFHKFCHTQSNTELRLDTGGRFFVVYKKK